VIKYMKYLSAAALISAFSATHANDAMIDRVAYTASGKVTVVNSNISTSALRDYLFPKQDATVLTRSIFKPVVRSVGGSKVHTSVAMLIQFEFDSDQLTELSMKQLDKLGDILKMDELSREKLVVEGHTDIIGSYDYNMSLSMRRASSVRQYLISEHNISGDRLHTVGKGEASLIDVNDPKGSINRRVQFSRNIL